MTNGNEETGEQEIELEDNPLERIIRRLRELDHTIFSPNGWTKFLTDVEVLLTAIITESSNAAYRKKHSDVILDEDVNDAYRIITSGKRDLTSDLINGAGFLLLGVAFTELLTSVSSSNYNFVSMIIMAGSLIIGFLFILYNMHFYRK